VDGSPLDHENLAAASTEVAEFLHEAEPAEFSPFGAVARLMRGRWLTFILLAALFAAVLGALGFLSGTALYESKAILRIQAREPGILYASGDDSRLKLFQSFVKSETTYVASNPVMERAVDLIRERGATVDISELTAASLAESIQIKRTDALIVLTSVSQDPDFAALKVNAVVDAYLALHEESKAHLASFRESELAAREQDLLAQLDATMQKMLDVGGEFGMASLVKAHIEKVSQIEALVARQGEVSATLASLQQQDGSSSADMADQEIMRATLLDRALADLNFDRAKREAELSTLLNRYSETAPQVIEKREEIAIIDRAMADRREQIKVLGQTGALTEGGDASREESIAEIEALLEKVTSQLEKAREDARELNRKRIELGFLEEERDRLRKMLDETRQALDVIRVESRNSMPGLVEVMSRAIVAEKPSEDSSKMMAAGGVFGGGTLALVLVFGYAISRKRFRFSDDLWRHVWRSPVMLVTRAKPGSDDFEQDMFRLRNRVLLHPGRKPLASGKARVIAVNKFAKGDSRAVARSLAASFAAAKLKTLFIDADLREGVASQAAGWAELLSGEAVTPASSGCGAADLLETGMNAGMTDAGVSVQAVRAAFARLAPDYEVIVVNAGSLDESLSSELILSASELAITVLAPGDSSARIEAGVQKIDILPAHGGGFVVTGASRKDPGLRG